MRIQGTLVDSRLFFKNKSVLLILWLSACISWYESLVLTQVKWLINMTIAILIGERLKQKFLGTNSFNFNKKPSKDYKNYVKQSLFFLLGNPPIATLINLFIDTFLNTKKLHSFVRTYVIHLLGTYVTILCNWLILWQNALYLYLGRSRMYLIL